MWQPLFGDARDGAAVRSNVNVRFGRLVSYGRSAGLWRCRRCDRRRFDFIPRRGLGTQPRGRGLKRQNACAEAGDSGLHALSADAGNLQDALGPDVKVFSQANLVAHSLAITCNVPPQFVGTGRGRLLEPGRPQKVSSRANAILRRPFDLSSGPNTVFANHFSNGTRMHITSAILWCFRLYRAQNLSG